MPKRAQAFIFVTAALGAAVIAASAVRWESQDGLRFVCYLLVALLASGLKVQGIVEPEPPAFASGLAASPAATPGVRLVGTNPALNVPKEQRANLAQTCPRPLVRSASCQFRSSNLTDWCGAHRVGTLVVKRIRSRMMLMPAPGANSRRLCERFGSIGFISGR